MEEFIHFFINLGIKLRTQFPQRYLDVNQLFQMSFISPVTAYIRIAVQIYNSKFVSLEMDSRTVKKLKNMHYMHRRIFIYIQMYLIGCKYIYIYMAYI